MASLALRRRSVASAGRLPGPDADVERRLLARARDGDAAAFAELVRTNADALFAVVRRTVADRHEAEDVTQEAFVRAWRALPSFSGDARFFTWLYRIAMNEAAGRARRRRPEPLAHVPDRAGPREAHPELRAEQAHDRRVLERAVARLPADQRAAAILRDVEGLPIEAAADLLGLRPAAFKSRLHRARLALCRDLARSLDLGLGPRRAAPT